MENTHYKFIKLLDEELPCIQLSGEFFTKDRLSNNQLFGALTSYAKGVNPNSVIGMSNANELYDGKGGILFSTSSIYFSNVIFPNKQVGHFMVRYCDILGVETDGDFLNEKIRINLKNLPFNYLEYKGMTIIMPEFERVLNLIIEFIHKGYECMPDRLISIAVVNFYMNKRNEIMRNVYDSITLNRIIDKKYLSCMDGLGLTPLHYCLILGNEDMALKIVDETLKFYRDIYLDVQPFGLYNFCYLAAFNNLSTVFVKIFEGSTQMLPLVAERKKQNVKTGVIRALDIAADFIPGAGLTRRGGKVVKKVAKGISLAQSMGAEQMIRNQICEKNENQDFSCNMETIMNKYLEECFENLSTLSTNEIEFEDPRYYILFNIYKDAYLFRKHVLDKKKLVCWNKRYFMLTIDEIASNPLWSELIVE